MSLARRCGGLFAGPIGMLRLRGACIGLGAALLLPAIFVYVDAGHLPLGMGGVPFGVWMEQYLIRSGWPLPSGVVRRPFHTIDPVEWHLANLSGLAPLPGILLWMIAGLAAGHLFGLRRRWKRREGDLCVFCAYPVQSLERCPECGETVRAKAAGWIGRGVQWAALPLLLVAALNLGPLLLYHISPSLAVWVMHVRHGLGREAPWDVVMYRRLSVFQFFENHYGTALRRHPAVGYVRWNFDHEGRPLPVDIVTQFGWPFPWYNARLANPPRMLLPRDHEAGWRLLIDEIDGAVEVPSRWRSTGRFRVQLAGDLMMRTPSSSAFSIRSLGSNLLFGGMVTLSLLALCISEPRVPPATAGSPRPPPG